MPILSQILLWQPITETLSTEQQRAIRYIWDLLNSGGMLDASNPWPGLNDFRLREHIIAENDPTAGPMPLGFAHFIEKEIQKMQIDHRTDWLEMNMV